MVKKGQLLTKHNIYLKKEKNFSLRSKARLAIYSPILLISSCSLHMYTTSARKKMVRPMGSTQSTKWCCRVEAKDANVQSEIKPNKLCEQRNDRVVQPSIEFH